MSDLIRLENEIIKIKNALISAGLMVPEPEFPTREECEAAMARGDRGPVLKRVGELVKRGDYKTWPLGNGRHEQKREERRAKKSGNDPGAPAA